MIKFNNQIRVKNTETGSLKPLVGNTSKDKLGTPGSSGQSSVLKSANPELAMFDSLFSGPIQNSQSFSYTGYNGGVQQDTQLSGLIGETEKTLLRYYRDIYNYDAVAGSMVDLMSNLPFSDFSLSACTQEQADIHLRCLLHLGSKESMPEIIKDYLVTGKHCSSMIYSPTKKLFTDLMVHDAENLTVTAMPFTNLDPVIEVRQSTSVKAMLQLSSSNSHISSYLDSLPKDFVTALRAGSMVLDPETTIFIARKVKSGTTDGVSLFRRVLPIYLLEKTLYRGTLVQAARRQGSILHAQVGDGTTWMPSPAELQAVATLIQQADLDPLSPVVVTRNGVNVSEFRQGGDFWKYTDIIETTNAQKLRALGIGEAFLSSESSYASMETSLSVFLESLSSLRDKITSEYYYNRVFPLVSLVNEMFVEEQNPAKEMANSYRDAVRMASKSPSSYQHNDSKIARFLADTHKLVIPKINWFKQLKPQANRDYLDILNDLEGAGLPVPLRVLAAAGGLDLTTLAGDLKHETDLLREVYQAKQERQTVLDAYSQSDEEGDDFGGDTGGGSEDEENFLENSPKQGSIEPSEPADETQPSEEPESTEEPSEEPSEEPKTEASIEQDNTEFPDISQTNKLEGKEALKAKAKPSDVGYRAHEYKGVAMEIPENARIEVVSSKPKLFNRPKAPSLSNILNRKYDESAMEITGKTKTGKPKYIHNQTQANKQMNEKAARALKALSDPVTYQNAVKRGGGKFEL